MNENLLQEARTLLQDLEASERGTYQAAYANGKFYAGAKKLMPGLCDLVEALQRKNALLQRAYVDLYMKTNWRKENQTYEEQIAEAEGSLNRLLKEVP